MTYIITPYNRAFEIPRDIEYECTKVSIGYRVELINGNIRHVISPLFTTSDYATCNYYIQCEDYESARYEAIKWLEDFLIRLSKNPSVIHCTTDGEIFVH